MTGRFIQYEAINIKPAPFAEWVSTIPPPRVGVVIPIPVIQQVGFIILVFGREAEGIGFGHRPCSPDDLTEGAVVVLGSKGTVGSAHQRDDVSVAVEGREIRSSGAWLVVRYRKQAAYTACSLQRAA